MNWSVLLLGIIPLFFFVVVDSFAGPKWALWTAATLALIEAIVSFFIFGELDSLTILSLLTVILLAVVAYRMKKPLYFKLQPVLMSLILGGILLVSYFVNEPLFLNMMIKYKEFYPEDFINLINQSEFQKLLTLYTRNVGVAMIFHGFVTAYAAWKMSNWWWILIRGVGFYFFLILAAFVTRWTLGSV